MQSQLNPAHDPLLLNLKNVALKGGERGPLYDQGVLAVIGEIERKGHFIHDGRVGIVLLMKTEEGMSQKLLTSQELTEGRAILAARGWSLDQGME
ncbi:MAG TPA: hypothetical protein VE988_28785 [Gemmataceae bacterium]|nr:hypothetical protein [Gemmataceae bacterium]